jgi:hypothetical protein
MRTFIYSIFLLMSVRIGLLADEATTNRVTAEFLTIRGFVQSKTDTNIYTLEHMTVREAAKRLGFSPDQMRPTTSQPSPSDIRTVQVLNLRFVISTEVRDSQNRIVSGSLDKLDALCTVSVSLIQVSEERLIPKKVKPPNKSPEPTAVGAVSSAVAVHVAGRRWLSFFR